MHLQHKDAVTMPTNTILYPPHQKQVKLSCTQIFDPNLKQLETHYLSL